MSEKDIEREQENIGKIRDILFGNNITEFERRFQELENKLRLESEKIIKDFNAQFDEFNKTFTGHIDKFEADRKKLIEENKQVLNDLSKQVELNRTALQAFQEEASSNYADMKRSQAEQVLNLKKQMDEQNRDLQNSMLAETQKLGIDKVDRKSLALLLSDLALTISGDNQD
ncbi:MAG: hypothetical protein ACK5HT_19610 [Draconibacterium sp.]